MNTSRKLEDVCTLEQFWELFLLACPPPSDMTREVADTYRWFYAAGLGCAAVLLKRLEGEPAEHRAAIIAQIEKQCAEATGVALNG